MRMHGSEPLQYRPGLVGAGFMPAFNDHQKIFAVLERGHKAGAYSSGGTHG